MDEFLKEEVTFDDMPADIRGWKQNSKIQVQGHHASHLILEHFDEVNARVAANDYFIAQTGRLYLVNVADCLEPLADVHAQRTDRKYVDEAIVLAADDLVFVDLRQSAHAGLRSYILDALEVLLHVEDLDLVLPGADEDQFLSQVDALGEVRSHVESQVERIAVKHINYCIRILHQDRCIAR